MVLTLPIHAYDFPLSESAIRDSYFLGIRTGGLRPDFLAQYARVVPNLKQGNCTSSIRIETPFLQVAKHANEAPNYSAQDAVKEFYAKTMFFRMNLDICYEVHAPPNAIKVKIVQNKKELIPISFESTPFSEATDFGFLPPNGEQIALGFSPEKIDSSTLTISIDTPNGQHEQIDLELSALR